MPSSPLILATSLVPGRDQAAQTATVASWRTAGFDVISVNGAHEADAVRAQYPGVFVSEAKATGEKFARKPVPFIHGMLQALRAACMARGVPLAQCTVGIINADIFLRNIPDFAALAVKEAKGALLLGPRVDVADTADFATYTPTGTETYSVGYDYFLMSGDLLDDFANSPFCLGMPFWDYWMPLVSLLQGRPLKTLAFPVALHVAHETRWDDTVYLFFHALISYVLELCRRNAGRDTSPAGRQFDLMLDLLSHLYLSVFNKGTDPVTGTTTPDPEGIQTLADFYDRFQQVAVHHIKVNATALAAPAAKP